jgi:hypothetical protein
VRQFRDWIQEYVNYASFSEAPRRMHFWSAVAAVAGALRRKVWIDQGYFKWHCNHYIIFVAPPGVVSKSTTVAIAIDILRQVPGVKFGPDVVTWPALVTAFAESKESFEIGDELYTQCALTLESSEFGNLVNPQDRGFIDLLVSLWDGKQGSFKKVTKHVGKDDIENPWINIIACTTPSWLAGNFPEYVVGGGFTSRCLLVYADKKDKLVAYPGLHIPPGIKERQLALVRDLDHIANNLAGPYQITKEATDWGASWYTRHDQERQANGADEAFANYMARKQTHIHKLAMILAASQSDKLVIDIGHLVLAATMITDLEQDMPKVFAKIGRSEQSIQVEKLLTFIRQREAVAYDEAYQYVHMAFPNARDFEGILSGLLKSGLVTMVQAPNGFVLTPGKVKPPRPPSAPPAS